MRLANDAQSAAKFRRALHRGVVRERSADFCQGMIEGEIMRRHFGRRAANFQRVPALLDVNRPLSDRPEKARA